MEEINKLISQLMPQMPRYHYWRLLSRNIPDYKDKSFIDKYAFAYTTEHTSDKYFWALIYKIKETKNGEVWKVIRKSHRRQRQKAKAVALKWYYRRRDTLKKRFEQKMNK